MLKFVVKRKNLQNFVRDFEEKIKKSGIYLKTSRQISEGEEVSIVFQFPEENVEIAGIGEVGWVDEEVDVSGRRGFLVRNIVLTPESLEIIERVKATTYQPPQQPSYPQQPTQQTPPVQPPPVQTPPPVTPPPQQQPPTGYQTGGYYNQPPVQQPPQQPSTPPPPPQQQPIQQPVQQPIPTANISVNVTSPPPNQPPPQQPNVLLEEDLKKLKRGRGWIWVLLLLLLGGAGYWFFGMGGKDMIFPQKVAEKKEAPKPEPPPPPPQPQKVIIEVKQQEQKPEPKPEPPPKPKPKPKPKKKKKVVRPAGLIDFVYDTGSTFTHLEFVFNRPYKKYIPSPLEDSLNIYIPNAYNSTGQDQYFLNSSLVRSVVISKTGSTLTITIYPATPSLPYYEFDREKDRLIINFYKNP